MNIIIPLGGKGERFKKQGYDKPKPLIKVLNNEILFYVIDNLFLNEDDKIFIIYNKELDDFDFSNIIKNKYSHINLIKLESDTKGASETVYIGLDEIIKTKSYHKKTMLIDCDIFYTYDIITAFRNIESNANAVFYTTNYDINPVFSYINMDENNNILEIKEKIKISDNANTGAYAFNDIDVLYKYSKYVVDNNILFNNECYTSCIIAEMIKNEEKFIGINVKEDNVFVLGTPEQVSSYISQCKLFLFDLDGTLVITDEIYFNIWTTILKDYNIFLSKEIFKKYIQGNNDSSVFNILLPNKIISIDDLNKISKLKDDLFIENIDKIEIIKGSIEFLRNIKEKGNKIVIVTNCNRGIAEEIIKYICITKYVDSIIVGNECSRPKPYPDPYLAGCKLFNYEPSKSFIFEDSKVGILSGRSVNPKCLVGIKTIYDDNTIKNLGVNIAINDYNELKYDDLISFNIDILNNIEKYIMESIKNTIPNITNVIIYNEKIKGGYISDVIRVLIETENNIKYDCILKLENNNETKLSKMAEKLGLYEREYYFYENISKYVNIEIPKFHGLIKDNNLKNIGILMENINNDNYVLNLNLNEVNINVSLKIIDSCVKLNSNFCNIDLNNIFPALLKNNNERFNPVWNTYVNDNWQLFKTRWNYLLTEKQINIAEKIIKNFSNIQNELSDKNLTLCHGDVKSPNIFYKKYVNDNDNAYIPYFIDWQYISNGKGVQDIVFLLIESFDTDKISLYIPLFKNYYYIKLLEYGVQNYSVKDYERDFINSICYYPFFVAIWFGITPEEDLIDKNFPFFFIQKLFNFILKYVPEDFYT